MSDIGFPPFSIKPVSRDGTWQREWWLFLHQMWIRSGGSGNTSDAFTTDAPSSEGETLAALFSVSSAAGQQTESALREEISALRNRLDALEQGLMI